MCVLSTSAFAATFNYNVAFPALGGNVNLGYETKSTNSSYFTASLTGGTAPAIWVWGINDAANRTITAKQKVLKSSGTNTVYYKAGETLNSGSVLRVRADAGSIYNETGSGHIDVK